MGHSSRFATVGSAKQTSHSRAAGSSRTCDWRLELVASRGQHSARRSGPTVTTSRERIEALILEPSSHPPNHRLAADSYMTRAERDLSLNALRQFLNGGPSHTQLEQPLNSADPASGYGLNGSGASDRALEAVRRFVVERGILPTAGSWTHACMSPSEKTIRRRFGSF
jgi:hypothetical protein